MPLTPPPRRAPAPQIQTLGRAVSTPQRADLLVALGERPGQVAVEDVAAGHAQLGLELDRGAGLQAWLAVGPVSRQSSIGSARTELIDASVAATAAALGRLVVGARTAAPACAGRTGSACGRRPHAARGRGCSGRSANGSRPHTGAARDLARGGLRVGALELGVALVDVEGAGEGLLGRDGWSRRRGRRASSRLSLSWAPSGHRAATGTGRPGPGTVAAPSPAPRHFAEQAVEHGWGLTREHVARVYAPRRPCARDSDRASTGDCGSGSARGAPRGPRRPARR